MPLTGASAAVEPLVADQVPCNDELVLRVQGWVRPQGTVVPPTVMGTFGGDTNGVSGADSKP